MATSKISVWDPKTKKLIQKTVNVMEDDYVSRSLNAPTKTLPAVKTPVVKTGAKVGTYAQPVKNTVIKPVINTAENIISNAAKNKPRTVQNNTPNVLNISPNSYKDKIQMDLTAKKYQLEKPKKTSIDDLIQQNKNRMKDLANKQTLTDAEKKEGKQYFDDLTEYYRAHGFDQFNKEWRDSDYNKELSSIKANLELKTKPGSGAAMGLLNSLPGMEYAMDWAEGTSEKAAKELEQTTGVKTEKYGNVKINQPIAYTTGEMAGNVLQLLGVGGAIKGGLTVAKVAPKLLGKGVSKAGVKAITQAIADLGLAGYSTAGEATKPGYDTSNLGTDFLRNALLYGVTGQANAGIVGAIGKATSNAGLNSSIPLKFIKALAGGTGSAAAGVTATIPTYDKDNMPSKDEFAQQFLTLAIFNTAGNAAEVIGDISKYSGTTKQAVSSSKEILKEANVNYTKGVELQNAGQAEAAAGYFKKANDLITNLKAVLSKMDAEGMLVGQTKNLKTISKLLDGINIPNGSAASTSGPTMTLGDGTVKTQPATETPATNAELPAVTGAQLSRVNISGPSMTKGTEAVATGVELPINKDGISDTSAASVDVGGLLRYPNTQTQTINNMAINQPGLLPAATANAISASTANATAGLTAATPSNRISVTQNGVYANRSNLTKMPPVADVKGDEIPQTGEKFSKRAMDFLENRDFKVTNPEIGDVLFSKRGIKATIAKGLSTYKAMAFASVPDVIEKGSIIDFQTNWKNKGYDSFAIAASVNILGTRHYVGVIVKRDTTANRFYVHEVIDEKGQIVSFSTRSPASGVTSDTSNPLLISLLQKIIKGNMSNNSTPTANEPSFAGNNPQNTPNPQTSADLNIENTPGALPFTSGTSAMGGGVPITKDAPGKLTKTKALTEDQMLTDIEEYATELGKKGVSYNKELSRNLDAASGGNKKLRQQLRDTIETPFYNAKTEYAIAVKEQLTKFYNDMKKLGIRKGSKESAAVFWIGSKERLIQRTTEVNGKKVKKYETVPYGIGDLQREFPNDWKRIVAAEEINRSMYNSYIKSINDALERIYPNALENAKIRAAKLKAAADNLNKQIADDEAAMVGTIDEAKTKSLNKLKAVAKGLETQYKNLVKDIETGDVLIGKRLMPRKDYMRHFTEMEQGFKGLFNLLTSDQGIDPLLVGVSDYTKPKTKWESFLQRRQEGAGYVEDAVGAMLRYVPAAEYKVHIDPFISYMRSVISTIQQATKETKNTNKLIEWLTDFTNDLAGKTNPFDRATQKIMDRPFMKMVEWLNNRVKANAILFNLNSAVAQWLNLPNGIATIKNPADLTRGAMDYMRFITNDPIMQSVINQSGFLTERYLDNSVRMFDDSILSNASKFGLWMLEAGDKQVSQMIWFAAYEQGIRLDVKNPIMYADDITRRSVGGRGIGEIPLTLNSRIVKLFAPFQIEVNNRWQFIKERFKKGDAIGLVLLYASTWLMNQIIKSVTGREPLPDPIQATVDVANEMANKDKTPEEKAGIIAGRLAGVIMSEMPYSQYLGMAFPEAQRTALFGENDPSRFGIGSMGINIITDLISDILSGNKIDITDTLLKILPPAGGAQISRTKNTLEDLGVLPRTSVSLGSGFEIDKNAFPASFTDSGRLRFAINPTPENILPGVLFGSFATGEGKKYIENNTLPLSENQTQNVKDAVSKDNVPPGEYVDYLRNAGSIEGIKDDDGKTIPGSVKAQKVDLIENGNMSDAQKYGMYYNEIFSEREQASAALASAAGIPTGDILNVYRQSSAVEPQKNAKGKAIANSAGIQIKSIIDTAIEDETQRKILYEMFDLGDAVKSGEVTQTDIDNAIEKEKTLQRLGVIEQSGEAVSAGATDVNYNTIPTDPFIKEASSVVVTADQMDKTMLNKLSEIGMNPKDYYYIKERIDAFEGVEKTSYLESLGFSGKQLAGAVEEFVMSNKQKASMMLFTDAGGNKDEYVNAFIAQSSFQTGTKKAEKLAYNEQLIDYLKKSNMSRKEKYTIYNLFLKSGTQYAAAPADNTLIISGTETDADSYNEQLIKMLKSSNYTLAEKQRYWNLYMREGGKYTKFKGVI